MVQAPVKRELGTAVAGKVPLELGFSLCLWQWSVDIIHSPMKRLPFHLFHQTPQELAAHNASKVWTSDPGTYPIFIIIGGACVFCGAFYAHK